MKIDEQSTGRTTRRWQSRQQPGGRAAGSGRPGGGESRLRAGAEDRRAGLRAGPPYGGHTRQQPGGGAAGSGRPGGGEGCLRAGAEDRRAGATGRTTRTVARTSTTWASCCRDLGDLAGARACLRAGAEDRRAAYGPDHPEVATDVNNLGTCSRTWATWRGRKPPSSGRWRSTNRPTGRTTRRWPPGQQPGERAAGPGRPGGGAKPPLSGR